MSDVARAREAVGVPPAEAFRLFTEAVGDWYRVDARTVPQPERTRGLAIEGRIGGRFLALTDDGVQNDVLGVISAWDPPKRFAYIDLNGCDVDVRFEPRGSGSMVTVVVSGLDALAPDRAEQLRRHGWQTVLAWYQSWLATHFA